MNITAMKRNNTENTYLMQKERSQASDVSFLQAVQEAADRVGQQAAEKDIEEGEDLWQAIADRKEEIKEKLRNGDTEVKYQIGAGSYTEKEWERMMKQFDSLEELIKYMMSERMKQQRQREFRQILGEAKEEEADQAQ